MKHLAILAGAIALVLSPVAALAQTGSSVQFPAGYAPSTSICTKQADGTCVPVDAAHPLPTSGGGGGTGGGGDASAANQTELNRRFGDTSSPAAGTLLTRVDQVRSAIVALGTPLQSGGTVMVGNFPATQAVTGTFFPSVQPVRSNDTTVAPTAIASSVNSASTVLLGQRQSTVVFAVSGLTASGATLTSQYTDDGTTWAPIRNKGTATVPGATTQTTDGNYSYGVAGHLGVRLIVTTAGSGNITIGSNASTGVAEVNLGGAGTGSGNPLYVSGPLTDAQLRASVVPVAVSNFPAAQTVTGPLTDTQLRASAVPTTQTNAPTRDTNGDLRVPIVTVTPFFMSIAANTSTELLAASATRVGYDVQCTGSAIVGISRTHATLSSATPSASGADLVIPAGSYPMFVPQYVSGAGVTAYTGTAQACWGNSYARQ